MIFTDASIKDGRVGGALYNENSAIIQHFKLPFLVSSMTAELVMMMKAVEFAFERGFRRIAILTDSKSGCLNLARPGENDICIRIHNMTDEARNIELVEFHYIPLHKGILGNTIVDEAAKEAIQHGISQEMKWPKLDAIKEIDVYPKIGKENMKV